VSDTARYFWTIEGNVELNEWEDDPCVSDGFDPNVTG
jgi:hypothetical protein